MKSIATFLGAALLCSTLAVQAQTTQAPGAAPAAPAAKQGQRPAFTPEQKAKFHADMKAARENCKSASDKRACVTQNFCAKQADAAQCQAKAKEHQAMRAKHRDQRQEIAEACNGKRGDALTTCYKAEAEKRGIKPRQHGGHRGQQGPKT